MTPFGKKLVRSDELVAFWCPGCNEAHHVNVGTDGCGPAWGFNENGDAPTFTPSVFLRSGHHMPGCGAECWCTFEARFGRPSPFACVSCHSFVTNGRIQFLADCSHALAGQTVDLPDYPTNDR